MNFLDRFKSKKGKAETPAKKPALARAAKSLTASSARAQGFAEADKYIIRPIISEKSNALIAQGKYAFEVDLSLNKAEAKKAIERIYNVHVTKVNTLRKVGKFRRQGK